MSARLITLRDGTQRLSIVGGWRIVWHRLRDARAAIAAAMQNGGVTYEQHHELMGAQAEAEERFARTRERALAAAEADEKEYAKRVPAKSVPEHTAAPEASTVALQRLQAAAWDVGQALGELIGCAPENLYAWRTVRMLVDVYVASEDLRMGPMRRKADGSPRERRPIGEACRARGVSEHAVMNQINRARKRAHTKHQREQQ